MACVLRNKPGHQNCTAGFCEFLPTSTPSEASRVVRRPWNSRRMGKPGRRLFGAFPFRPAARKLSTSLRLYTASLDAIDGTKYGLAQCPCCQELVSVFVRSRGQLLCLECAGNHAA